MIYSAVVDMIRLNLKSFGCLPTAHHPQLEKMEEFYRQLQNLQDICMPIFTDEGTGGEGVNGPGIPEVDWRETTSAIHLAFAVRTLRNVAALSFQIYFVDVDNGRMDLDGHAKSVVMMILNVGKLMRFVYGRHT